MSPQPGRGAAPEAAVLDFSASVRRVCGAAPFDLAVILGSGLGGFADAAAPLGIFPYADAPAFPAVPTIAGQAGRLIAAEVQGRRILFFQGRFHGYQGLSAWQVATPVRIAHALGAPKLLLASAVGAINPAFAPGDLVMLSDHLNLCGITPLSGLTPPPFVDLNALYCTELFAPLRSRVAVAGTTLHRGVLALMPGPAYETPAEIRALDRLGADVVGMSLVPEALMAAALGMEVVGLSLVTNRAAGLAGEPPSHAEVLAMAAQAQQRFNQACAALVELWMG